MDEATRTVGELTREIKSLVDGSFPSVTVVGEISDCRPAPSGHVYLTLKDAEAQLSGVIWRGTASKLAFEPTVGLEVIAQGSIEVYAPRGSYQLMIRRLTPKGVGALDLAIRQLRDKLAAEGLFDDERKRPLPRYPRRIALVTSPTGAAVRDMLQVITRRWPAVDLVLLPVRVQGDSAAAEIAGAFERIPGLRVDVVITGRGGGSLEDLAAFNDERVARAIAACAVPVVSAVGHEIDVSISDLVADRRALTPSEAGELVVPHRDDVAAELAAVAGRLAAALRLLAKTARGLLTALAERPVFARPYSQVHELASRLDDLDHLLSRSIRGRLDAANAETAAREATLEALSPLNVLGRGYTLTRVESTGRLVRTAEEVAAGDRLVTVFVRGRAVSRVETVDPESTPSATPAEPD